MLNYVKKFMRNSWEMYEKCIGNWQQRTTRDKWDKKHSKDKKQKWDNPTSTQGNAEVHRVHEMSTKTSSHIEIQLLFCHHLEFWPTLLNSYFYVGLISYIFIFMFTSQKIILHFFTWHSHPGNFSPTDAATTYKLQHKQYMKVAEVGLLLVSCNVYSSSLISTGNVFKITKVTKIFKESLTRLHRSVRMSVRCVRMGYINIEIRCTSLYQIIVLYFVCIKVSYYFLIS